jgi:dodecin
MQNMIFIQSIAYFQYQNDREVIMDNSIYKVITLVGTSPDSWEKAASNAVELASKTLEDLRIAEVEELDMGIDNGKVTKYRAKIRVSFKYRSTEEAVLEPPTEVE